jgi:hypothetical protein
MRRHEERLLADELERRRQREALARAANQPPHEAGAKAVFGAATREKRQVRPLLATALLFLLAPVCADPNDDGLEALGSLLSAWPPSRLSEPDAYSPGAAVPVLDFAARGVAPSAAAAAALLVARQRPFVARGAPGLAAAARLWARPGYLQRECGEGAAAPLMHLYEGASFQNGFYTNAVARMRDAREWWARWAADALVDDDVGAPGGAGPGEAPALGRGRRGYLQMSSLEPGKAFLERDVALFGLWRRHACTANEEADATAAGDADKVAATPCASDAASDSTDGPGGRNDLCCRPAWATPFVGDVRVASSTPVECRFGLAGTKIEAHFDTYDNFVALVVGRRRFVLAPPAACPFLNVSRSPSRFRHSLADFEDARTWASPAFGEGGARATQVVLEAGDVLYIPPFWFHFIVSLTHTAQCSKMVSKSVYHLDALACVAESARAQQHWADAAAAPPAGDNDAAMAAEAASALAGKLACSLGGCDDQRAGPSSDGVEAIVRALLPAQQGRLSALPPWATSGLAPFSRGGSLSPTTAGGTFALTARAASRFVREVLASLRGLAPPCEALEAAEAWAPNVSAVLLYGVEASLLARLGPATPGGAAALSASLRFTPRMLVGRARADAAGIEAATAEFALSVTFVRPTATTPVARLRLHFQGLPALHSDDIPVLSATKTGDTNWAELTDFSAARENAVYEFELRELGGAAQVRRTTTVHCLPSFRGWLGAIRRARLNTEGAVRERAVAPNTFYVMAALLVGPALLPCLVPVFLFLRWKRSRRPKPKPKLD